ncbi:uncharacterized protein LOC143834017 isoform X2 [Paroedura picta]|uniref:uncharacterized protein LOC143834017 isoform X2 n=1 Tax=Paroedura picta TaxID=143630 RepID=UPI0040570417
MATWQLPKAGISLQIQAALENWVPSGFRPEEQGPAAPKTGEGLGGAGLTPEGIQGARQRTPVRLVKEEPGAVLLQQWETQWQEFLRMLESQHSRRGTQEGAEEHRPWDDTEGFLAAFEQVAKACQWPREKWVIRLLPALSGEAAKAFHSLDAGGKEDYGKVKAAILRGDALSREKQRQQFRHFCYQEAEGPRGAYDQLQGLCHGWLKVEKRTKEQILELLILEQFLTVLPPEVQSWVRESSPESCSQAVALAEGFLRMQEEAQRQEQQQIEVDASLSEAVQSSPDPAKEQQARGTKVEEDGSDLCMLAGERMTAINEMGKYIPGDFEQAGSQEVPSEREAAVDLQIHNQENAPGTQPGCQRRAKPRLGYWQESKNKEVRIHKEVPEVLQLDQIVTEGVTEDVSEGPKWVQTSKNKSRKQQERTSLRQGLGKWMPSGAQAKKPSEELLRRRHKAFTTSEERLRLSSGHHQRERSEAAAEAPYQCTDCGRNFIHQRSLHTHQRLHTGEKLNDCSSCGKKFLSKSKLARHQRLHTGERPYRCSYCSRSFSQSYNRNEHERTHVVHLYGEKPAHWGISLPSSCEET